MYEVKPIPARVLISGTFECRDKDGNLVKTIELKAEIPLEEVKEDHGDQRSE